jgi:hypothetical protein
MYRDNWSWYDMLRCQVFVKDWNLLPKKYKTDVAIRDMTTFLMRSRQHARYMDCKTNCYLYDIARGDLTGPSPFKVSLLQVSGAIVTYGSPGRLLLGMPRLDNRASVKALEARLTPYGYYHVYDYTDAKNLTSVADGDLLIG